MKRIILAIAMLALCVSGIVLAEGKAQNTPATTQPIIEKAAPAPAVVDYGNKICPVLGNPVSGQDFVVYKGVRYGVCCSMCIKMFNEDPEKYIKKLKEQAK